MFSPFRKKISFRPAPTLERKVFGSKARLCLAMGYRLLPMRLHWSTGTDVILVTIAQATPVGSGVMVTQHRAMPSLREPVSYALDLFWKLYRVEQSSRRLTAILFVSSDSGHGVSVGRTDV